MRLRVWFSLKELSITFWTQGRVTAKKEYIFHSAESLVSCLVNFLISLHTLSTFTVSPIPLALGKFLIKQKSDMISAGLFLLVFLPNSPRSMPTRLDPLPTLDRDSVHYHLTSFEKLIASFITRCGHTPHWGLHFLWMMRWFPRWRWEGLDLLACGFWLTHCNGRHRIVAEQVNTDKSMCLREQQGTNG